jgi:uncharacterized membrane protein YjgN (DUF898 family)
MDEPGRPGEPTTAPGAPHVASIVFTGRGGEYFRIWVVNLLLTLLTFGVYSAWAKARKARYFRNNTCLDGHVFDYHGRPVVILRGRIIAFVLLTAYTWAFNFSNLWGLLTLALLCVVGPWLFMRAQQFTLSNTSFRGLRFGFRARPGAAYRAVLPVLVLWFAPTAAEVLATDRWWLPLTPILVFPWMHHRLKAYQRAHAVYGDRRFTFEPATLRFYGIYAKGAGLVLVGGLLLTVALNAVAVLARGRQLFAAQTIVPAVVFGVLFGILVYVGVWPYLAARLQRVVWNRTRLGDISFRTEITARRLRRLVFRNVSLTLLTGGVYWPWAAIALARYRIECVRVESEVPLSSLAAGLAAPPVTAAGEGAADAFGFDIGL